VDQRRSCKVAEFIYQVLKVALSMYRVWISEDEAIKLRSLYIKCLKFRCLGIECGSVKMKLSSCGVYISSV